MSTISRDLRTLFQSGAVGGLPDGQLLERFIAHRDEAAFEVLLERHGPMVRGVCSRIARNHHDAEDAFQATFLVLARKAAKVSPRENVASWLYGVASRTALKARATAARRRIREGRVLVLQQAAPVQHGPWRDLEPLLDQELSRLPETYRAPLILCGLEGKTRKQAAQELGWPEGTLSSRLSRAREALASRLARRGLGISGGMLVAAMTENAATAAVPTSLIASTARAAALVAAGRTAAGTISSQVITLAKGVGGVMGLEKVLVVAASLMFVLAGGGLTYVALASEPPQARPEARAGSTDQPPGREADVERVRTEAKSVLDRALRSVSSVEDLTQRVWILCQIARTQARGGFGDRIGETLKRAVHAANDSEHDHRVIEVAECQAEVGHGKEALETLGTIRRLDGRKWAVARIAAAQAKAGDLNGAFRTAATIPDNHYSGEALWRIAVSQAEGGDFEGALATAATITPDYDRAQALTAIAARQFRAEDPAAARTLKQAQEAADKIPVVYDEAKRETGDRRPSALAEVARVLASTGATDDARKVAQRVTNAPWHDIAWKNIAAAQADRGEIQAAMETAGRIGDESEKGEALKGIVIALVRANDLATARKMADGIEWRPWRAFALLEVAKGHSHAGRRQDAAEIFDEVRRQAESLEDDARHGNVKAAALGRLAKVQAEVGEEQAALAWIDRHPSPLIKAWSLLGLAEGLVERLPANPRPKPALAPKAPSRGKDGPRRPAEVGEPGSPPAKTPTVRGEEPGRGAIDSFRGKLVLFGSQRNDDPDTTRIEAIQPDGMGLETLLVMGKGESIESGRVSPDGKRMAFTVKGDATDRREVWVLGIGGMRRKIADGVVVAWSPDGTRLACIRGTMGDWESLIVDIETGRTQRLPILKTDLVVDWSPAGQALAVMAGNVDKVFKHPMKGTYPLRQIYLLEPDGSGREVLTTGAMLDSIWARFSPDGMQVVYHQRRYQEGRVLSFAVVQGRDRGMPKDLVPFHELNRGNKEFGAHGPPAWSTDGMSVAWITRRRRVQGGDYRMELVVISVPTAKTKRIDLDQKGLSWVQAIDWR